MSSELSPGQAEQLKRIKARQADPFETIRNMADKARKAQQAVNDLGAGSPQDRSSSRDQSDNTEQETVTESYVKVTVDASNDYGPAQVKFNKARTWDIDPEGFLILRNYDRDVVAVFAPRTWKYVELVEE